MILVFNFLKQYQFRLQLLFIKENFMKTPLLISASVAAAVLSGCVSAPPASFEGFQAKDLSGLTRSGAYVQKTDNFLVIHDSSDSMNHPYTYSAIGTGSKHDVETELLKRMNQTIPDSLKLTSGLRNFGFGQCHGILFSTLLQPMTAYSKASFDGAIDKISCASGGTPISTPIEMAGSDLSASSGRNAVIVFSDGMDTSTSPIPAVQALKATYGDKLCIYSVWVGNEADVVGRKTMNDISDLSACGFSISGAEIASSDGMADFVKRVFFQAVNVAAPAPAVDGDDDRDGVLNSRDKCPRTPLGATVNYQGCWVIKGVNFDTNKSDIKPRYYGILDKVVTVIRNNPGLNIEVQGHTDSRGSAAYNMALSDRRASSVEAYLSNGAGGSASLTSRGYGFTQPIDTNETDEGMAHNRRVQLKVHR